MTGDEINKLTEIIKEGIRPVKDLVEMTKKRVDGQDLFLHTTAENVRRIKEQQSLMNEKIDGHSKVLEKHLKILDKHSTTLDKHSKILDTNSTILEKQGEKLDALWEQTIKLNVGIVEIKDILKTHMGFVKNMKLDTDQNTGNVNRLDKRLCTLEDKSGVVPPAELTIVG